MTPFDALVITAVRDNAAEFPEGFEAWVDANMRVVRRFFAEADKVWDRGRRRYSARTIIEVLRHETSLADLGEPWKLNNNSVPALARLYLFANPGREGLFELRYRNA